MRLLRLSEVDNGPDDRVFRHARLPALLLWLLGLGADAWMLFNAVTGRWPPGYIFGPGLLFFLLAFLGFVTARFHASNWLARANSAGLFLQYRSYLNYPLPVEDPTVVFLPYVEITSAHLVRERIQKPDMSDAGTTTQFLRYVELELSGDTGPLARALRAERAVQAPMRKRWWGGQSSRLYRDYPLVLRTPSSLRIRWDVTPGASRFLAFMRPYTPIVDAVSERQDFANVQTLGQEEQQQRLRELALRGEMIAATQMAQHLHGCSLAQAKAMVEGLVKQDRPT